jgi:hypothetical protein
MKILNEITQVSLLLIKELKSARFFSKNTCINSTVLKKRMEIEMQRKWNAGTVQFILSEAEFVSICKDIVKSQINSISTQLFLDGELHVAVNKNGELTYYVNEELNEDDL